MTTEQIAREETIGREDLLLGNELIDRINTCRQCLRNQDGPLSSFEREEVYRVLGDCASEVSKTAFHRRQDQLQLASVLRLLEQMKTSE